MILEFKCGCAMQPMIGVQGVQLAVGCCPEHQTSDGQGCIFEGQVLTGIDQYEIAANQGVPSSDFVN